MTGYPHFFKKHLRLKSVDLKYNTKDFRKKRMLSIVDKKGNLLESVKI